MLPSASLYWLKTFRSGKVGDVGTDAKAPVETDFEIWRGEGETFRSELLEVFADNDRRC